MAEEGMTCGQLLRTFRQAARLTQEELAERSGYSVDYLSKLERDLRQPPLVALDRLAGVLGLGSRERDQLQAVRRRHRPAMAADQTGLATSLPPVPVPPTPLLGRDAELAVIGRLLSRPEVRLVTIVGPGGVGKTRLALEVAAHRQGDYPSGVGFVDLAPLSQADLVVPAIAQALGVRETAGRTLHDVLVATLRE